MDTKEIKGVVLDLDVLAITSEQFKTMGDVEFCHTAVRLDRINVAANEVGLSVAEYIHNVACACIERNGGYPYAERSAAVRRDFLGTVAGYEAYLKSELAGQYRVQELPMSISAAARKLDAGLERGADLRVETSSNKVQQATAKINKQKKEDEKQALLEEYQAAQPASKASADVELTGIQLKMAQMAKQYEEIAAIDPERAEDMIAGQQSKVERALAELKAGIASRMAG